MNQEGAVVCICALLVLSKYKMYSFYKGTLTGRTSIYAGFFCGEGRGLGGGGKYKYRTTLHCSSTLVETTFE